MQKIFLTLHGITRIDNPGFDTYYRFERNDFGLGALAVIDREFANRVYLQRNELNRSRTI